MDKFLEFRLHKSMKEVSDSSIYNTMILAVRRSFEDSILGVCKCATTGITVVHNRGDSRFNAFSFYKYGEDISSLVLDTLRDDMFGSHTIAEYEQNTASEAEKLETASETASEASQELEIVYEGEAEHAADEENREHNNVLHAEMHEEFTVWNCLMHLDVGLSVMMTKKELDSFTSGLEPFNEIPSNFRAYTYSTCGGGLFKVCRKHITSTCNELGQNTIRVH